MLAGPLRLVEKSPFYWVQLKVKCLVNSSERDVQTLVNAKMYCCLPSLYYPTTNFKNIQFLLYIKDTCYFLNYILTNRNLQVCSVETYKPFCSFMVSKTPHLSFVPLGEYCLCPDCCACAGPDTSLFSSPIPGAWGQNWPQHRVPRWESQRHPPTQSLMWFSVALFWLYSSKHSDSLINK